MFNLPTEPQPSERSLGSLDPLGSLRFSKGGHMLGPRSTRPFICRNPALTDPVGSTPAGSQDASITVARYVCGESPVSNSQSLSK